VEDIMNGTHTNGDASYEAEAKPTFSPYSSPSIPIHLKDSVVLYIPEYCLQKCDKLHRLYQTQRRLDLDSGVGHVVVHYLVTDTYQPPTRPSGPVAIAQTEETLVAELKTGVGACVAARTYEMAHLLELARAEVETLGARLPAPLVLRLLQEAYTLPAQEDDWLYRYVEGRVRAFLKDPTEPLDAQSGHLANGNLQVFDLLVKSLYEIYRPLPEDADLHRHHDGDHFSQHSFTESRDPRVEDVSQEGHHTRDLYTQHSVANPNVSKTTEETPALTSDNISSPSTDVPSQLALTEEHSQPIAEAPAAVSSPHGYQEKWATLRGVNKRGEDSIEHASLDDSTVSENGRDLSNGGGSLEVQPLVVDADHGVKLSKKERDKIKKRAKKVLAAGRGKDAREENVGWIEAGTN
jgi:hypothetical protein